MSDTSANWKHESSPCSGCRIRRKKCSEKCVLAPYFPRNDPQKFLLVHRIFGNGHVVKLLQMSDTSANWKHESSPCSGCKILRKKCSEKCVLAPYFPRNDPQKFLLVHRIFGNGHVVKLLQDLPAEKRGDAVSSMVYEASERVRDPVHGCKGVIHGLQKKVAKLQLQLESAKEELGNARLQYANLLTLITGYEEASHPYFYTATPPEIEADTFMNPAVLDNGDPMQLWEPLWSYSPHK